MKRSLLVAITLSLAYGAPVLAQDKAAAPAPAAGAPAPAAGAPAPAPKKWAQACDADMKKLCKDEMAGGGDVRPCLAKKENDLTPECKDSFLVQYRALEICKPDFDKLCKDAGGQIGKCIAEKQNELSEKCRAALSKASKQHKKVEKAEEAKKEADPAAAGKPAKGKKGNKGTIGKKDATAK